MTQMVVDPQVDSAGGEVAVAVTQIVVDPQVASAGGEVPVAKYPDASSLGICWWNAS